MELVSFPSKFVITKNKIGFKSCLQQEVSRHCVRFIFICQAKTHKKYDAALETLNACAQNLNLDDVNFVYGSGAVKNANQVLDYANACYLKLPKAEEGGGSIWDYAATACIVTEANGWASNIYGDPLELNRQGSSFMNHQGVIYASNEQIAQQLIDAL